MGDDVLLLVHDLRNELCAIDLTFRRALVRNKALARTIEHSIAEAHAMTRRLSELLGRTAEPGRRPTARGLVRICLQKHFQQHTIPWFEALRKKSPMRVRAKFTLADEPTYALFNPAAMRSARNNVVHNAQQAGATRLNVHYHMRKYVLEMTFADNGRGMSTAALDRIYARAHGDGVVRGLGTATLLDNFHRHGFFIWYESAPGKGTTVKAIFPYCA